MDLEHSMIKGFNCSYKVTIELMHACLSLSKFSVSYKAIAMKLQIGGSHVTCTKTRIYNSAVSFFIQLN